VTERLASSRTSVKLAERCDRCGEPIAERVALLPGASALHVVVTAMSQLLNYPFRSERKFKPNYCKSCVGLYNFYFASFLGVLAIVMFVLVVIVGSR